MSYFEAQSFQDLMKVATKYLEAATKETEARTALMGMEYQEIVAKQEEEQKRQEQDQGMMRAPYGYCPKCGAKGSQRFRSTGTDVCENGHIYLSKTAVLQGGEEADDNDN